MIKLLYFSADWCAPCKRMKPIVKQFIEDNPDILFVDIDVDEEYEHAQEFRISSVPTTVVVKDGEEFARKSGAFTREKLEQLVFGENNG